MLGCGALGQAFVRALARNGIVSSISDRGWTRPLAGLVDELRGMTTLTCIRRAAEEDIVFLSVPWTELPETLTPFADWEGRIVIDATVPKLPDDSFAELGRRTSSEVVSDLAQGAQVVKAFSSLSPEQFSEGPQRAGGTRVIVFAGDHVRAKGEVGRLIRQLGFAPVDLGALASGGKLMQPPGGPFSGLDLISVSHEPG